MRKSLLMAGLLGVGLACGGARAETATGLKLLYDGPDSVVLFPGASYELKAAVENCSDKTADVTLSLACDSAVAAASPAAGQRVKGLVAKGRSDAFPFKLSFVKEGGAVAKLTDGRGDVRELAVKAAKLVSPPFAMSSASKVKWFDFQSFEANSDWVLRQGDAKRVSYKLSEEANVNGLAFPVDGRTELAFSRPVNFPERLYLNCGASGEVMGALNMRGADGKRTALVFRAPAESEASTTTTTAFCVPSPELGAGAVFESLTLTGKGEFKLFGLGLRSKLGEPPGVVLKGTGLRNVAGSTSSGVIVEAESQLTLTLPEAPGATLETSVSPLPAPAGAEPSKAVGQSGMELTAQGVGAYELTVGSEAALPSPAKLKLLCVPPLEALRRFAGAAPAPYPLLKAAATAADEAPTKLAATAEVGDVIQSAYSPAALFRPSKSLPGHSVSDCLGLPDLIAVPEAKGVSLLKTHNMAGTQKQYLELKPEMAENWLLAVSPGAKPGAPARLSLFVLSKQPEAVSFQQSTNSIFFAGKFDFILWLPLGTKDYQAPAGPDAKLSDELLAACRWWSRALLWYPVGERLGYQVKPAAGTVTLKHSFDYLSLQDAWGSKELLVAPVAPAYLAALKRAKAFPVKLGGKLKVALADDTEYPVVEGASSYELSVEGVVAEVNQVRRLPPMGETVKALVGARDQLYQAFGEAPSFANLPEPSSELYPKVAVYASAKLGSMIMGTLANYYHTEFLVQGAPSPAALEGYWAYLTYSGDRELARAAWPSLRKLVEAGTDGKTLARLAYLSGDLAAYYQATLARTLDRLLTPDAVTPPARPAPWRPVAETLDTGTTLDWLIPQETPDSPKLAAPDFMARRLTQAAQTGK